MGKICDVCSQQTAHYVCLDCGKSVCENCFIPERWLCIECYRKRREYATPAQLFSFSSYKLFLAGFILIMIGSILVAFAPLLGLQVQGGGLVWIFPFPPFIFGAGLNGKIVILMMVLLVVATLMTILAIFLHHRG